MTRALRILVGMALGAAGVAAPAWALFHLVRQPPCGSDGETTVGPPCPDEFVWWVLAIIGSVVVLIPLAVWIAGRGRDGRLLLLGPIIAVEPIALAAAVVVSHVGASSDPDTHWVGWLVAGLAALMSVVAVRALARMGAHRQPMTPAARPAVGAADPQPPPQVAVLAAQLRQVAAAKQAAARDDLAARLRRLDELRAAGAISAEEHARRRDEILDEV